MEEESIKINAKDDKGNIYSCSLKPSEKFSQLIKNLKRDRGYKKAVKVEGSFKGKKLKEDDVIKEVGISNLDNNVDLVIDPKGNVIDFGDRKKAKQISRKISETAQKWRYIKKGLNILGICTNEKCEANKKEIIYNARYGKFDLSNEDDRKKVVCPLCKNNVVPKTCGFFKCKYKITAEYFEETDKKFEKETKMDDEEEKTTEDEELLFFQPPENAKHYLELKIETSPLDPIPK